VLLDYLIKNFRSGYDTKTVGEDMEIIVRMRRYMEEKKQNIKLLTFQILMLD
jgi:hypothetical protein